jgi:hypothetical protein
MRTSRSAVHDRSASGRVGLGRLAIAPVTWLAHFVAVYVLATLACEHAAPGAAVATAVALATFLATGMVDYRRWRALPEGTAGFVSLTSLLLCALSALAALWVAYPAFVLPACGH